MERNRAMHAVILAGGKGTRLRPYTTSLPKPLVPIGEEFSILEIVLRQLRRTGFKRVTIAIGHLGQLIRAYVGDGERWGLEVDYAVEESPLGTIGPLLTILDRLPDHFLVTNGDVLTDLDFGGLLQDHIACDSPLTIATCNRRVKIDFGVLEIDVDRGTVHRFTEKPTFDYRVSMGIYGKSKATLESYTPGLPFGFDELVLSLLENGRQPRSYEFDGYWLDIGRPDDYERANEEFPATRHVLLPTG
jgi:NDP-sugar pyrophosphorylase family protein